MDPLANLKDIHLPAQIHEYPVAPGWWVLAAIILTTVVWLFVKWLKIKKHKLVQRSAIKKLHSAASIEDVITILKWSAMHYFSRHQIAKLYGTSFAEFLIKTLPAKKQEDFNALLGNILTEQYTANAENLDVSQFIKSALFWVENALPPKNVAVSSSFTKQPGNKKYIKKDIINGEAS